jgi:hypothetical protein
VIQNKRRKRLEAPKDWYLNWETTVKNLTDFQSLVSELGSKNVDRNLVWRGISDASLALTSSLFRNLTIENSDGTQKYPTESEMQKAEKRILDRAIKDWRLSNQDPHEIMAQLQHLGAPTRFIDVTKNPYVALWFACGEDWSPNSDGRLLVFGVKDTSGSRSPFGSYAGPSLFWHDLKAQKGWGKNAEVNVWFPPFGTHERVFAQNAGFIFGGVPTFGTGAISNYLKGGSQNKKEYWPKEMIRQATSIHFNPSSFGRKSRADQAKTPSWTIRVPSRHKRKILSQLEKELGISRATLFPGLEGLSESLGAFEGNISSF